MDYTKNQTRDFIARQLGSFSMPISMSRHSLKCYKIRGTKVGRAKYLAAWMPHSYGHFCWQFKCVLMCTYSLQPYKYKIMTGSAKLYNWYSQCKYKLKYGKIAIWAMISWPNMNDKLKT